MLLCLSGLHCITVLRPIHLDVLSTEILLIFILPNPQPLDHVVHLPCSTAKTTEWAICMQMMRYSAEIPYLFHLLFVGGISMQNIVTKDMNHLYDNIKRKINYWARFSVENICIVCLWSWWYLSWTMTPSSSKHIQCFTSTSSVLNSGIISNFLRQLSEYSTSTVLSKLSTDWTTAKNL